MGPEPEKIIPYTYSRLHRSVEILALGLVPSLCLLLAFRVVAAIHLPTHGMLALAAALAGWIAADFGSGLVHWMSDRYGSERTPIFGSNFIRTFREHHTDSQAITRHDFIEVNGDASIISVPPLVLLLFLVNPSPGAGLPIFLLVFSLSFFPAIYLTNQIHKWSHMDRPPGFAVLLQRLWIILPPAVHGSHHRFPFDRNYCITTGWLNWPLRRLRIFEIMEWMIRKVFRVAPFADEDPSEPARNGTAVRSRP